LIGFTARAVRQLRALRQHYEDRQRPEAIIRLMAAVAEASRKIEANPEAGLAAPRPYPQLARPGRASLKVGRYWISYTTTRPPVIAAVFYETADIPGRV
jgi:plasmid stabilization system protein ParE